MKQDLDISNVEGKPKRDRIRIERKKYDELVAERDRLKAEVEKSNLESRFYHERSQTFKIEWGEERQYAKALKHDLESKAAEHAHLDTLARKLRDQRDMARFIAALLLIVSVGFAVAVWIGKLIPVV